MFLLCDADPEEFYDAPICVCETVERAKELAIERDCKIYGEDEEDIPELHWEPHRFFDTFLIGKSDGGQVYYLIMPIAVNNVDAE